MPLTGKLRQQFLELGLVMSPRYFLHVESNIFMTISKDQLPRILGILKRRGYIEGNTHRGYRLSSFGRDQYRQMTYKPEKEPFELPLKQITVDEDPYGLQRKSKRSLVT